jgi:hypothetical protein
MSVKVTVYDKQVMAAFAKAEEVALVAMGEHMTDALADNTHKVTGLLANSYNYRTPDKQGPFGNGPEREAKKTLGPDEQASQPPDSTVRVSSALQYTEPYNNRFKVFEKTIDNEQRNLGGIANAAYKKVIGT